MFTLYDNNTFNGEKRGFFDAEHTPNWTGEEFNSKFAYSTYREAQTEAKRLNDTGEYNLEVVEVELTHGLIAKKSDIEIVMLDGKSENEAKEFLNNGTAIFEDFEEHFNDYMEEWGINIEDDEEFYLGMKRMIDEKIPYADWGIVEAYGTFYYIQYCF